jgi:hypothetical protein
MDNELKAWLYDILNAIAEIDTFRELLAKQNKNIKFEF